VITASLRSGVFAVTSLGDQPVADTSTATIQALSLVIGVFIPVLVALVTKASWHPGLKAGLLAGLSAVSAAITEWLNSPGDNFVWSQFLLTFIGTVVTAVAFHFGIWKPTVVTEKAQAVLVKDRA